MTRSRSTPRIRFTQALYTAIVVLVAISERRSVTGLAGAFVQLAGLLVMGGAALGRLWTSLYIAGRKDRELVTDGPYAVCRNPLYAFSVVGAIGIGLATRSLVVTLALPALLAILTAGVVRAEESLLARLHGDPYARYLSEVPRFWPDLALRRRRDETVVLTPVYFKAFLDAASFLLLYALIVAADLLARSGVTPTPLVLP
ncbi:MAG TPA: isoprenylcysteine carboxylmethyltransferase family protein [Steroidobacteraceae bacterium]|nr:isoprenylcysteine carboxylmethyltransferase family protein [Steroidobacteraceae bacterium]